MILLVVIFAVLAASFAAKAAMLTHRLKLALSERSAANRRLAPPPPPSPPRHFEYRLERYGLLWFPELTALDGDKVVVGVSSGLPHCPRCICPLKLSSGRVEEWICSGCDERHPGRSADLIATDAVLTDCLREFFTRHPDYSPALELSAPRYEAAAAA